jgi:hypothetical protein
MEQICERTNLNQAYRQVKANKGAPGVDGITIEMVKTYKYQTKNILVFKILAISVLNEYL